MPADAMRAWLGPCLALGLAFAAAHGQAPLYYSNQNQYFLHGLAEAGDGRLRDDWLAQTLDPTPAFSSLVGFTARYLHPILFYLFHGLLLGVYAAALLGIFVLFAGAQAGARWPAFALALVALHSAAARWCGFRLLGGDYLWYLQSGVAGQYVLGAMYQPSVFGALLVAGVALFAHRRTFWAGLAVAAAASMHQTYLLPGAFLTLGFMASLFQEGRRDAALALGAMTLALVLPVTFRSWWTFAPTSADLFARAQAILVHERIPHHCRVDLWLDPIAALQIAWIGLGVALAWRTRLFLVLAVASSLGAALTLLQTVTASDTLALLFPWRISAVLVPLATAIVLSRLLLAWWRGGEMVTTGMNPAVRLACLAGLAALGAAGIGISVGRLAFRTADEEKPLYDFVRAQARTGDVYLLPVSVPDLARTIYGSSSSDYKPLPQKRTDKTIIPLDLQRFRLHAGAPIFVDFKSIPYKDVEVIEWRERLAFAEQVQERLKQGKLAEAVDLMRERGITHLVRPAQPHLAHDRLELVLDDSAYRVYRLR